MLIWMCALHCEAKPVIDAYRLRKSKQHQGFDLYHHAGICCIVSGVGALKMAAATAWAAALYRNRQPLCWINLGIAGHRSLGIGSAIVTNCISASDQVRDYHLSTVLAEGWTIASLISYPQPQNSYPEESMADMEAYAFVDTASRFSNIKWCQSIKIISDNAASPAHHSKQAISQMIAEHLPAIRDYATAVHQSTSVQP